jgi:hypothetical protein
MGGKLILETWLLHRLFDGISYLTINYISSFIGSGFLFPTVCAAFETPLLQQRGDVWISNFNWRITRFT